MNRASIIFPKGVLFTVTVSKDAVPECYSLNYIINSPVFGTEIIGHDSFDKNPEDSLYTLVGGDLTCDPGTNQQAEDDNKDPDDDSVKNHEVMSDTFKAEEEALGETSREEL